MPKFKYESQFSLKDTLMAMGMKDAFENADFSGITGDRSLLISEVIHDAVVAVDEKGTEAAAATAVVFTESASFFEDQVTLTIDRPFIYYIMDSKGSILFMGEFVKPQS
jgi:serpin B